MLQIHEKIRQARVSAGLTEDQMAEKLGIKRSTYQYWEQKTPKVENIMKVAEVLKLDIGYFFGKKAENSVKPISFDSFMETEFLPVHAQAGYLNSLQQSEVHESLPVMLVPKEFEKGRYLVIEVQGDSMDDGSKNAICEGDRLLVKELDKIHWKNKLHFNRYAFVIVHKDGIILKRIIDHDLTKGKITVRSLNRIYEDREISLKDVYQLFYVKKIVERKINF